MERLVKFFPPPAKLKAEELGVDLAVVSGTGPEGLVTEKYWLMLKRSKRLPNRKKAACQM